jgi:hypothetical protein
MLMGSMTDASKERGLVELWAGRSSKSISSDTRG